MPHRLLEAAGVGGDFDVADASLVTLPGGSGETAFPRGVKAAVFDVVGTLVEPSPSVAGAYQRAARRQGVEVAIGELTSRFGSAWKRQEAVDATARPPHATSRDREWQRWQGIVQDVFADLTDADTAGDAKSAKPKGRTRKKAAPKTAPETADNADNDVAVDAAGGGEEDAPKRARKKAPAAKTGTAKKAKKAAAKKTARKKAAPKSAAADSAGERAPVTSEKVADETQRAPISSAPQDVIEVGEAKPQGRKRGWWNRG